VRFLGAFSVGSHAGVGDRVTREHATVRHAGATLAYAFGPFRLDPEERLLTRGDQQVPLTPKAFDLLVYLLERHGRLVDKQALMAALWPDAVVEETNLASNVSAVRKALCDGQEGDQYIQTVPTRGYRFVAPVRELPATGASVVKPRASVRLVAAAAIISALIGGFAGWRLIRSEPAERPVIRFEIPAATALRHLSPPAISPDGTRVAYVAAGAEGQQLHVRALDSVQATPLPGTGDARWPFFSPDGRWIGFFAGLEQLMKVEVATGHVTKLAPVRITRGATWGRDNNIYFSAGPYSGLAVVSAMGGQPRPLTTVAPDEIAHGWPELLPSGRHLIFTSWDSEILDDAKIEVLSLDGRARQTVLRGGFGARYLPTGHLVYFRRGSLMAVSFDARTLRTSGSPVKVMEGIAFKPTLGEALFAVSPAGMLAYVPGADLGIWSQMVWIELPGGKRQALDAPAGFYVDPTLSPDGRRLALAPDYGSQQDIWVTDLARGTWTRATVNPRQDSSPVWRPDDPAAILFSMGRGGPQVFDLFSVPADGSRAPELVYESPYYKYATSSSAAARLVAFIEIRPDTKADVWLLDLSGKPVARPFLQSPFWESSPALSPDGAWLAYESDESGRREVYVRAVSGAGGRWQISNEGGDKPRWWRDGSKIVYRSGRRMLAARVSAKPSFAVGESRVLFEGDFEVGGPVTPNYDIAPDGSRLLMIEPSREQVPSRIVVVDNWFRELRQNLGR
jgi:DNA-binding winged helix-turn-helix (wHTH) protein/Tol biopolymer transport system component